VRVSGLEPDRFVQSAGHANYDDYVFDLDLLDGGGNPTVAHWGFKENQLDRHRQYWHWFETEAPVLIFGV
jgi:hypothetical protein